MDISRISAPGTRQWLAALGVKRFDTQEPSDLEYDPQLRVVAEWRDPQTLQRVRVLAEEFRSRKGYRPPEWQLLRMAKQALEELR